MQLIPLSTVHIESGFLTLPMIRFSTCRRGKGVHVWL